MKMAAKRNDMKRYLIKVRHSALCRQKLNIHYRWIGGAHSMFPPICNVRYPEIISSKMIKMDVRRHKVVR